MKSLSKLSKFMLLNVWTGIIEAVLYVVANVVIAMAAKADAAATQTEPTNINLFSGATGIIMVVIMLLVSVAWLVLSIKIWSNKNTPDVKTKSI